MDWDEPGTNVPSTVLGAAEGLGTNNMDEIELTGAPLDQVKRRFRRQNNVLQGKFPETSLWPGSRLRRSSPSPHSRSDAQCRGSSEEFPNCTPIWANIPQRSIANYIRQLAEISK